MNKSIKKIIDILFYKNLIVTLSTYVSIVVLLALLRLVPTEAIGMLLVPVLIASTVRWKLRGGLISAIFSSIAVVLCHLFLGSLLEWRYLLRSIPTGIIGYFLIVITVGFTIQKIEEQRSRLIESERRYKNLYEEFRRYLDLVQVMIVALDREGKVIYINNKTSEILGYEEEEIVGKNWFENFIPKRINGELREVFKKIISGNIEPIEYYESPIVTRDGKEKFIAWHNTLLYDESGIAGSLSAGEDITELRNLERQNQERLRNLGILYDAARELIIEDLDVYKRSQIATRICVEDFGADLAWIGYKENDGKVKIIAQYPPDHPYNKELTLTWDDLFLEKYALEKTIRTSIPEIIEDTNNDNFSGPLKERLISYDFQTMGVFPLITSRYDVFGVLIICSKQAKYFTLERKDLIHTLAHLTATSLENARLFENIQKDFEKIRALHSIDTSISESLDIKVILNTALTEVIRQLNIDATTVFLYKPSTNLLEYVYGKGFKTRLIEGAKVRLGESLAGLSGLERSMVKIPNLKDFLIDFDVKVYSEDMKRNLEEFIIEEGFVSYYAVPLISKGQLLGVLEVFKRSPIEENRDWEQFLEVLAKQIAIGIDNARLFRSLEESNIMLLNAYEETIEGWAYVLDLRDKETEGHSRRVADLTIKIAERMGIREEELIHIRRGALLHDIGKIAIPDSILLKPEKLTEEE